MTNDVQEDDIPNAQDPTNDRVEHMLATAKTKADLQHLARSLDARNMTLQRIVEALRHELAQLRKARK